MIYANTSFAGYLTATARAFSLALIALFACVMIGLTLMAATGYLPWLQLDAGFGSEPLPRAGMWFQIGLTCLAVALCFYIPSDIRMQRLETSHRKFEMTMDDVARAYAAVHAQDRDGAFKLSSEFDAVRERLAYLRSHPDLRTLEPAVLEVAAQMSEKSRELAEIYSSEKIARARTFLRQRQEEAEDFDERLQMVRQNIDELRRWEQQLNVDDSLRRTQLEQLERDLLELLPGLGYEVSVDEPVTDPMVLATPARKEKPNVVSISPKGDAVTS